MRGEAKDRVRLTGKFFELDTKSARSTNSISRQEFFSFHFDCYAKFPPSPFLFPNFHFIRTTSSSSHSSMLWKSHFPPIFSLFLSFSFLSFLISLLCNFSCTKEGSKRRNCQCHIFSQRKRSLHFIFPIVTRLPQTSLGLLNLTCDRKKDFNACFSRDIYSNISQFRKQAFRN